MIQLVDGALKPGTWTAAPTMRVGTIVTAVLVVLRQSTLEAVDVYPVATVQFVKGHARTERTLLKQIDVTSSASTKTVLLKAISPLSFSLSKSKMRFGAYQTSRFKLA